MRGTARTFVGTLTALCQNAAMPEPTTTRPPLLPPRVLKVLAIAFAIGIVLFLMLWLDQRRDSDFFKASGPGAPASEADALPAPLPADVASEDGNASGLRIPAPEARPDGDTSMPLPRIVEAPAPAPMPAPDITPTPVEPALAEVDQPIAVIRPPPRYPQEALRRNIGGLVRVEVLVAPDGSVERMALASSSGDRFLDRAALEAVRRWRFQPAVRNGQPVAATVVVPLEFNPGR